MHYAPSTMGVSNWAAAAHGYVHAVCLLQSLSGRPVHTIDFGGGWTPHLMEEPLVQTKLAELLARVSAELPGVRTVYFEPGKALSERAGGMITRVQHVRDLAVQTRSAADAARAVAPYVLKRGAVVDACICDLGSLPTHPHPVLKLCPPGERDLVTPCAAWAPLAAGGDILLGRICMEWDVVASGLHLPAGTGPGDYLLLAYTGAYDMSMGYDFGRGGNRGGGAADEAYVLRDAGGGAGARIKRSVAPPSGEPAASGRDALAARFLPLYILE